MADSLEEEDLGMLDDGKIHELMTRIRDIAPDLEHVFSGHSKNT